jgi:tripartite-type tricarboxylate transporter receptor subunit TctC
MIGPFFCCRSEALVMARRLLIAAAALLFATPACAQFYKGKTLTLMVNYGAGGNIDTEARILARHLPRHIAGNPTVIIQDMPGAGGLHAMNLLGLNIKSKADGLTAGYFTISPTAPLIDDPALKINMAEDYVPLGGATGWTVAYARKDTPPGLSKPADFAKATKVYFGGYSRSSAHDTRIRLALEVMGLPYRAVTGFPSAGDLNKAFQQNEINMSTSSLPAYQTQVVPNIIATGIGIPLWHYAAIGPDGAPEGNPSLARQGIPVYTEVYKEAFGKMPSGEKFDALLLMNDIATKLQRGFFLPKGAPDDAVADLRKAFLALASDADFVSDYERITKEKPDFVDADAVQRVLDKMRSVRPEVRKVLKDSIGG